MGYAGTLNFIMVGRRGKGQLCNTVPARMIYWDWIRLKSFTSKLTLTDANMVHGFNVLKANESDFIVKT